MNLFKRLFTKKHRHSKLNSIQNSLINKEDEVIEKYFTTSNIYKISDQLVENEIYVISSDELLSLSTTASTSNDTTSGSATNKNSTTLFSTNTNNSDSNGNKQLISDKPNVDDKSFSKLDKSFEHGYNPPLNTKQYKIPTGLEQINQIDSDDYVNVNDNENHNEFNGESIIPEKNKYISDFNKTKCNPDTVTGVEDILNMIMKELNKIIIEREDLRKKLVHKTNSYNLIKRKLNTILTNRFYKPIRLSNHSNS